MKNINALREDPTVRTGAAQYYKKNYYEEVGAQHISDTRLRTLVFDNSLPIGVYRMRIYMRRAMDLLETGKKGVNSSRPMTREEMRLIDKRSDEYTPVLAQVIKDHYIEQAKNPDKAKFLKGWLANRAGVMSRALDIDDKEIVDRYNKILKDYEDAAKAESTGDSGAGE
ncbi:MAG: hypothetical protein GWN86_24960 [Desulfobacterales bacterium]|nr:hypothetical protein [Desulfobacterales bacterium]